MAILNNLKATKAAPSGTAAPKATMSPRATMSPSMSAPNDLMDIERRRKKKKGGSNTNKRGLSNKSCRGIKAMPGGRR